MCGIFGRFGRSGDPIDPVPLIRATNMLAHRGPDDGAWWSEDPFFLAFRRLAIIDLKTGAQPMATPDGRFVIVFNGEIYNYVELRDELRALGATFRTTSDTEVILSAYQAWGEQLPEKLVGMFALAIVDRLERALFLARDRFGEKPLFFLETPGEVMFASELTPLAALARESDIDVDALASYLCLNYVPGERTLLASIQRLPPAGWARFRDRGTERGVYWRPPPADDQISEMSNKEALAELRGQIDASVRIALRSDVPVALFLSGGIDSSIIAESAVRQGKLRHAYCLDFAEAGFSEYNNASSVANRLGLELRRVVLSADALPNFLDVSKHADDPLADASQFSVWTVAREAAKDYKVVISGDGGDELFGGYLTYPATAIHGWLAATVPMPIRRVLARQAHHIPVSDQKVSESYKLMRFLRALDRPTGEAHFTWNGTWLPEAAAQLFRSRETGIVASDGLRAMVARHGLSARPGLSALQRADIGDYLPNDILAKVDRMTMAHGLEARAPFLVHTLAEYALRLPNAMKLRGFGPGKRILRWLAADLFGPDIAGNKKQGFSIPVHQWLRGPLRATVEELLSRARLEAFELLDVDAVLRAKNAHMTGREQLGFELWGLMTLMAWHQARVADRQQLAVMSPVLRRVSVPPAPSTWRSGVLETSKH
jgi:asparagine synthase (glutamine-hydrolysing)